MGIVKITVKKDGKEVTISKSIPDNEKVSIKEVKSLIKSILD